MARQLEPRSPAPARGPRLASRAPWLRIAAIAATAAGLAFGFGWQLGRPAAPGAGAPPTELEARLTALSEAVVAERAARESLALELAALRARLDEIAAQRPAAAPSPAADVAAASTSPGPEPSAAGATRPRAPLFDAEALVHSCMNQSDVERLRARWERYQLDTLALNDRARREDFFMQPRHGEERSALDAAFRNDVGEDGYDAFLRATGKPNRIAVRELLPAGAGNRAGLEVGDELVQYAGARVFSVADLLQFTASGRLGEPVVIEIVRDGQPLSLRATRGPLGVVFDPVQRAPEGGC